MVRVYLLQDVVWETGRRLLSPYWAWGKKWGYGLQKTCGSSSICAPGGMLCARQKRPLLPVYWPSCARALASEKNKFCLIFLVITQSLMRYNWGWENYGSKVIRKQVKTVDVNWETVIAAVLSTVDDRWAAPSGRCLDPSPSWPSSPSVPGRCYFAFMSHVSVSIVVKSLVLNWTKITFFCSKYNTVMVSVLKRYCRQTKKFISALLRKKNEQRHRLVFSDLLINGTSIPSSSLG